MRYKVLLTVSVALILIIGASLVQAMNSGSVSNVTYACDHTSITYEDIHFDRDNTGSSVEAYTFVITDGVGNVLFSVHSGVSVGGSIVAQTENFYYSTPPVSNPIHVVFSSDAGNGLSQQVLWSMYGNVPCLPAVDLDTCIAIPSGSVVGDLPFQTQAFYSPGKLAPDVFLNPGTYWVIGQDEAHEYYEIVLACQYLWVPVNSMQPSYQAPQNGAPLPTRVVD